ncbi:MAG TPA: cellulase family glycosylhydrolase [Bacteroidia bacterium]|nr:cellulase family glycosylhydrolase [Bacteroidia bacterium]
MKVKFIVACLLAVCALRVNAKSFISRDGQTIVDSTGKSIQLKGVNLGGWLLWEGWIWGGGYTKEGEIAKNMETISGKEEFTALRKDVYLNFINESDIKAISELGMNVVRVPFNHRIFDTAYCDGIGWQVLDSVLKWCDKYHVYAILDMHSAVGGQSNFFIADPVKPNLWQAESNKQRTINLWMQIAGRYKNRKIIAGYDLLNEPIPTKSADLVELYDRIIKGIRTVDTNHMVIVEGGNFAKQFDYFTRLPDNNMMFSFHIYTWFGGEPKEKLINFAQLRERLDVPVWCGEWGENSYEVIEKTLAAFAMPENKFSGWCFWTWKKTPNNYAALNAISVTTSWKDVIVWCGRPKVKTTPNHDVAVAAMKEFRKAMRYEETNHDYRLGQILSKDALVK